MYDTKCYPFDLLLCHENVDMVKSLQYITHRTYEVYADRVLRMVVLKCFIYCLYSPKVHITPSQLYNALKVSVCLVPLTFCHLLSTYKSRTSPAIDVSTLGCTQVAGRFVQAR